MEPGRSAMLSVGLARIGEVGYSIPRSRCSRHQPALPKRPFPARRVGVDSGREGTHSRRPAMLAYPVPLLTGALSLVVGAPVPLPKPWIGGWDKPVNPLGDCWFNRHGDKLRVTVPGRGHSYYP